MDDHQIVELYWARSESAIKETEKKYGKYCRSIANAILHSPYDAEECVNDALMRAWETIPPQKPSRLAVFVGKLTRNVAINRYVHRHAQKRSPATDLIFDEVAECIPDPASEAPLSDELALKVAMNTFLAALPANTRCIFLRRYWYMSSIREIARDFSMTESAVKVTLLRTRNKFRLHLEKEGILL